MATDLTTIQRHNEDVIFSEKSLEEFIRLIQRQGINNLTIYSVNNLLNNEYYKQIRVRYPPPTPNLENGAPLEFALEEIENKRNYFVFVRYSFAWENGKTGDKYNNELNGRHVFVQTVNDIKYYKVLLPNGKIDTNESSVFSFDTTASTDIKDDDIFAGNTATYSTNGTFVTNVDNMQYVIKIRGFNDNGEYTGAFKPASVTDSTKKFLRGDGKWTNELKGPLWINSTKDAEFGSQPAALMIGPNSTNDTTASTMYIDNNEILIQAINPATTATITNNPTLVIQKGAGYTQFGNTIYPDGDYAYTLGTESHHWKNIYGQRLYLGKADDKETYPGALYIDGTKVNLSSVLDVSSTASGASTAKFWRGDLSWTNVLEGALTLHGNLQIERNKTAGIKLGAYGGNYSGNKDALIWYNGKDTAVGDYFGNTVVIGSTNNVNLQANKVYKAVFNDYAEFRSTINLTPGHCVKDNDDGTLSCTEQRLIPGAQVISDTYGDAMGRTEKCQTPLAVAGRVLVYTYQPRENYHAGMAVCSAPGGTVDIMTREEIKEYPDCIVGIVSEIPQYEKWGTDEVNVNGRIWIKVK